MADRRTASRRIAGVVAMCGLVASTATVGAQSRRWDPLAEIPSGTSVQIRMTQPISSNAPDGRIYEGIVDADVFDNDGRLAIENGATAELIVRRTGADELMIDLESITVNGRRYAVRADSQVVGTGGRRDIDINRETGEYAAGGAVLGAIIGAVTGGKKGAAIGAGVGAAAGAGAQIATRGRAIDVPAEALLSYRLTRPLTIDVRDTGYDRDGVHYHRWR